MAGQNYGERNEAFIKRWWRPAMAVQYMLVCFFDFIIFPGIREAIFARTGDLHEWRSLTLQNGGLYHMAMGAIVGTYVWQKSKEFIASTGVTGSTTERVVERSSTTTAPTTVIAAPGAPAAPPATPTSTRAD
jgi:hypothetical protein